MSRSIRRFMIEWDRDYGMDHRRGWTVCVNGIIVVQFCRSLPRALYHLIAEIRRTRRGDYD